MLGCAKTRFIIKGNRRSDVCGVANFLRFTHRLRGAKGWRSKRGERVSVFNNISIILKIVCGNCDRGIGPSGYKIITSGRFSEGGRFV